jgi:hypothetical protein
MAGEHWAAPVERVLSNTGEGAWDEGLLLFLERLGASNPGSAARPAV